MTNLDHIAEPDFKLDVVKGQLRDIWVTMHGGFARIDSHFDRIDGRLDKIDSHLDKVESKIDARFNRTDAKIDVLPRVIAEMITKRD